MVSIKPFLYISECSIPPAPPPSPNSKPEKYAIEQNGTFSTVFVPYGYKLILKKYTSPEVYKELLKGDLPSTPGKKFKFSINLWSKCLVYTSFFRKLEKKYSQKLWEHVGKKKVVYTKFDRIDFSNPLLGTHKKVCHLFLCLLSCKNEILVNTNGKFMGIKWEIVNNSTLTTRFSL